jgi:hypothetical protein
VIKKRLKNNTNLKKEEIKKVLKKDINIGENIFCPKNIKLPIKIKEIIEKKKNQLLFILMDHWEKGEIRLQLVLEEQYYYQITNNMILWE